MKDELVKLRDENIELKGALIAAGQLLGSFVDMTEEALGILKIAAVELRGARPELAEQVRVLAARWEESSQGLKAAISHEKSVAPPASVASH